MIPLEEVDLIPHHRKTKHVGLEVSEAPRPNAAEEESRRPKQLAANRVPDISLMTEIEVLMAAALKLANVRLNAGAKGSVIGHVGTRGR